MAFEAVDEDGSGGLDVEEISTVMDDVAGKMGVTAPTQEDLEEILMQLDNDFDGIVDKVEFNNLLMLCLGKMLENEGELQEKVQARSNRR